MNRYFSKALFLFSHNPYFSYLRIFRHFII